MTMAARFKPGDKVRVRVGTPPGHFRTPAYIQGRTRKGAPAIRAKISGKP
ncbi:MAG TPA: SH3-like domain-containing protein [Candidatus Tectomicrobia bacterium]|nr:SH3-like domain-containing protein [Candidatus Tectomicrobia bacterium]